MYNVLFLCTGNSARSVIAESLLNQIGENRFQAFSAGSQPKGQVHPFASQVLAEHNHPTETLRSKSWDEFSSSDAPEMDFVFTLCDSASRETCPVWLGKPITAHWGLPDPAAVEGSETDKRTAFQQTFDTLAHRLHLFKALPTNELNQQNIQTLLDEISQSKTN